MTILPFACGKREGSCQTWMSHLSGAELQEGGGRESGINLRAERSLGSFVKL